MRLFRFIPCSCNAHLIDSLLKLFIFTVVRKKGRTSESSKTTASWEVFLHSLCLTVHFLEVFSDAAWMQMRCQIQQEAPSTGL